MILFKSALRKKAEKLRAELYTDLILYSQLAKSGDKQKRAKHHICIAIETIDKLLQE